MGQEEVDLIQLKKGQLIDKSCKQLGHQTIQRRENKPNSAKPFGLITNSLLGDLLEQILEKFLSWSAILRSSLWKRSCENWRKPP
ncbi:hypothetical protein J1N35_025400 [Gossypium stocksii]|uniref:Uncharacterized protein n=1 Tax=Gossypium stocksii TaxID=47602 RepID=A0A9D3V6I5_9ROSI|nr:hypothetical protein J1N35_025400 [Gossypium stocksii]